MRHRHRYAHLMSELLSHGAPVIEVLISLYIVEYVDLAEFGPVE